MRHLLPWYMQETRDAGAIEGADSKFGDGARKEASNVFSFRGPVSWREASVKLWMPSLKSHYTYHTDWKIDRLTAEYRDRRQDVAQEMEGN